MRLVGEQLSPVIAGDLESSALPVGVFEWWVENPGPDPLTVGIMLTWQDPAADRGRAGPAGAWHETIDTPDVGGAILHAPVGAPPGLRGTFALAASRDARRRRSRSASRFDAARRHASCGPTSPPTAGSTPSDDAAPSAAGEADRGRRGGDRRAGARRAAVGPVRARLGPADRRVRRRPALVEALHADWGRTGERAFDLAAHALEQAAALARRRSRPGSAPILESTDRPDWYKAALFNELYFLVDGGTFWEAGEVGGPEPDRRRSRPLRAARVPRLPVLRHASTSTSTRRSRSCALFPELEARGIRDLLAAIAGRRPGDRRRSRRPGLPAPRKVGGTVPHDVGGPDDDPFHRPNRYRFQDVNDWKDLGPKFVLQVWRDAVAAGADGDALIRDAWPTVEAS